MVKKAKRSANVFSGSLMTFVGMLLVLGGVSVAVNMIDPVKNKGVVLSSESNNGNSNGESGGTTSTVTATQTVTSAVTTTVTQPTTTSVVTATATPTPTVEVVTVYVTKVVDRVVTVTQEVTRNVYVETQTVVQAPPAVTLQGTTDTIRVFLKKIGLPVSQKVITVEPEKVVREEEVISAREAGSILKDLQSLTGADKANGEVRLRFKPTENKMTTIEAESFVGQGITLSDIEVDRIKNTLEHSTNLRVSASEGGFVFSNGNSEVDTTLPLLVDLKNNLLTTETSTGIKAISVLPDSAVMSVEGSGLVSKVNNGDKIKLIEREDGKIAYQLDGEIDRKLFGLINLKSKKTIDVSAESGRVLNTTTSFGDLILNWLAPKAK